MGRVEKLSKKKKKQGQKIKLRHRQQYGDCWGHWGWKEVESMGGINDDGQRLGLG